MRFELYDLLGMLPVDPATPAPHTSTHVGLAVGPGYWEPPPLQSLMRILSSTFQARAALTAGPADGPLIPPARLRPHLAAGGAGRRGGGRFRRRRGRRRRRRRRRRVPAGAAAGCACRPATSR